MVWKDGTLTTYSLIRLNAVEQTHASTNSGCLESHAHIDMVQVFHCPPFVSVGVKFRKYASLRREPSKT